MTIGKPLVLPISSCRPKVMAQTISANGKPQRFGATIDLQQAHAMTNACHIGLMQHALVAKDTIGPRTQ